MLLFSFVINFLFFGLYKSGAILRLLVKNSKSFFLKLLNLRNFGFEIGEKPTLSLVSLSLSCSSLSDFSLS